MFAAGKCLRIGGFAAGALALLLLTGNADAQGRGAQGGGQQNAQAGQCPQNMQAGQSGNSQMTAMTNGLQNAMQQLTALQQSGKLTNSQQQAVSQQMAAVQNALQQLNSTSQQGSNSTGSLQSLRQQQLTRALQQRSTQSRFRR